jgi:DNA mismatch repair protein MutS
MQQDTATLKDLSVFTPGGGIFNLLDHTRTRQGKDALHRLVLSPPKNFQTLKEYQDAVRYLTKNPALLPNQITNGTLVMLEQFFESADFHYAMPSAAMLSLQAMMDKVFNKSTYSFNRFSLTHIADFLSGMEMMAGYANISDVPALLQTKFAEIAKLIETKPLIQQILNQQNSNSYKDIIRLNFRARRELKHTIYNLVRLYAEVDALQSLAVATLKHNWVFPTILPEDRVCFKAKGLYHPLLKNPVAYDLEFDSSQNFLILTGANMSGKTTFMRAIGIAALLAHLGAGVPATHFEINFLHGIITNMHVEDNILTGESYFLAEVRRMKRTAEKLREQASHLVLMDELFKGTNVYDAYECTRLVTEELIHKKQHILVLSTHLYEVAQQFKDHQDVRFACFVTNMTQQGEFSFTYTLKEGISDDRLGSRILQDEGVLNLLQDKPNSSV